MTLPPTPSAASVNAGGGPTAATPRSATAGQARPPDLTTDLTTDKASAALTATADLDTGSRASAPRPASLETRVGLAVHGVRVPAPVRPRARARPRADAPLVLRRRGVAQPIVGPRP
ncbi:radical SAM protein, partial [Frankia sp. AgB1.8]|nr:radical SAM protein [Frankia sp. AgB1.8]